jgi:hypothetical protein
LFNLKWFQMILNQLCSVLTNGAPHPTKHAPRNIAEPGETFAGLLE